MLLLLKRHVCLQIPLSSLSTVINEFPFLYDLLFREEPILQRFVPFLKLSISNDPRKEKLVFVNRVFQGSKSLPCIFTLLRLWSIPVSAGRFPGNKLQWFVSRSDDPAYPPGTEYRPSSGEISASLSLRLVGLDLSCIKEPLCSGRAGNDSCLQKLIRVFAADENGSR